MSAMGPVMQNFMQIPPKGASWQMGEIYTKFFMAICLFSTHPQVRPIKGFLRLIRHTTQFCTKKCLFGVRKLKFNIEHIYSQKIQKNYNGAYGEN